MSYSVHNFLESGNPVYRKSYETSRSAVHRIFEEISSVNLSPSEQNLINAISSDLARMEQISAPLFSLPLDKSLNQKRIMPLDKLTELDTIITSIGNTIEQHQRENSSHMKRVIDELHMNRVRVRILFLITLITSVSFLIAFGLYIHRKVSVPLNDLWKGAEEISLGNLDYRMQVPDDGRYRPACRAVQRDDAKTEALARGSRAETF